ncbi:MAG TPA: DUF885 family protein [Bryobacteraceae bacterium]|nr:DUF885 family protein [Bryobacteraceae bacterium]
MAITSIYLYLVFIPAASRPAQSAVPTKTADQQFESLLAGEWQYELRHDPQLATIVGDDRYNSKWKDYSLAAVTREKQERLDWLERFRKFEEKRLDEDNRLNRTLMLRKLQEQLTSINFKNYEMPINPHSGLHLELVELVGVTPFRNSRDYQAYIDRLHRLPTVIDQIIQVLKQGLRDHLVSPRYLSVKAAAQCRQIADRPATQNPFGVPASQMSSRMSEADREHFSRAILDAVDANVRPGYLKLADFLAREYAPQGREQPGLWALPDGDKRYRFAIREMTTTDLDPETIHELGLSEVSRIEHEEVAIAQKLGFTQLSTFRAAVKHDPKLIPQSEAELFSLYRKYISGMEPLIPQLTHLGRVTPLEIRSMGAYNQSSAASAKYLQGTDDGSRPGILLVNTSDLHDRTIVGIEATAYHEGIPGHHLQISIAQHLPLPAFRKENSYTAYTEGWALYAELLGKELGFYRDPYSDYGRLSNELLRAVRLVVDTGLHYRHWKRQDVVDFFHEHTSEDEPTVQSETDRYVAQPAQALAYKIGEQQILEMRAQAKAALGNQFDIRAFHDQLLGAGSLPLDVLQERMNSWIKRYASSR